MTITLGQSSLAIIPPLPFRTWVRQILSPYGGPHAPKEFHKTIRPIDRVALRRARHPHQIIDTDEGEQYVSIDLPHVSAQIVPMTLLSQWHLVIHDVMEACGGSVSDICLML